MDDDAAAFARALSAFGERLGDTHLTPLALAVALHLLSLAIRSRVWCGILRVAFPDRVVPYRPVWWAYLAGVGANVIAPARGGDVVRLFAVRRVLPRASVATLISTLVAETAFGAVVVVAMATFTAAVGWLPPLMQLPDAAAFDISFYARHVFLTAAGAILLAGVAVAVFRWSDHHVRALRRHLWQGLRILESPRLFVTVVALPQLADWVVRVAIAYCLLAAFGIHASIRGALLVLIVDSVATAMPFTPGGAGAQQGLLVLALGGTATTSQILAFSVGSQLIIALVNIVLGLMAIFVIFGHAHFGRVRSEASTMQP
jgi:uncharacterized membrane protein YbhN (UPF0104 family)